MTEIAPAILTNDLSDFRKKYAELFALSRYFTRLHVDFIDGKFILNRTVMPAELEFLKTSPFKLAAHLMTLNPAQYFNDLDRCGFSQVLFHYEAFSRDTLIEETIVQARELGLSVGLSLNPETPLLALGKFITEIDAVQLMGIHPGYQGREFIAETMDKVKELRQLSASVIIIVDGGVKVGIARKLAQAGADVIVTGSAILRSEDEEAAIEALKSDIETQTK